MVEHDWPMNPLNAFKVDGVDHTFYANDQELDILEKSPNITIIDDRRDNPVCICCKMELDPVDDLMAEECFVCRVGIGPGHD